ncbi:hypothetical protein BCR41DRAFT_392112 [Lobosporangium transversale]|uniref:F-box domain-containing protein n=1 Tax=Lobosporangium transversale TaxID=64571 RepID=A0A1Y2GZB4_9FUNG|nr:hypothetical protein BCR41DRAFT_392112 [Lobosporangium transversale]ORZ27650.1 hypothetical protein BCR41DRAFT_392112 [Lobosporangium transversale]|eukprot:XP_021885353.1 hypothetical protein BCR41DRAFT_392112 [Lobosporangium transversale]
MTRLQSQLQYLKTLLLQVHGGGLRIGFFDILNHAPNLIEFEIKIVMDRRSGLIHHGDAEDDLMKDNSNTMNAHWSPEEPKVYHERYGFRVFNVEKCAINQHVLERIVSTCPKLRVFKVRDINDSVRIPGQGYVTFRMDHERLLKHTKRMCSGLEWYNVTNATYAATDRQHVERIHCYFTGTRFLSLPCCRHEFEDLSSFVALPAATMFRQHHCPGDRSGVFKHPYIKPYRDDPIDNNSGNNSNNVSTTATAVTLLATEAGAEESSTLYIGQLMDFPHVYDRLTEERLEAVKLKRDRSDTITKQRQNQSGYEPQQQQQQQQPDQRRQNNRTSRAVTGINKNSRNNRWWYWDKKYKYTLDELGTLWPCLEAFHILYRDSDLVGNYESVLEGASAMRPEIEFIIKQRFAA